MFPHPGAILAFPSRLAGLSYFHRCLTPEAGQRLSSVSIPSGGIILFPRAIGSPHPPPGRTRVRFHPVWRDYPISTQSVSRGGMSSCRCFHPVWRDYPISTQRPPTAPGVLYPEEFPSRLAGLSYFHWSWGFFCYLALYCQSFHPVWRDYPISTMPLSVPKSEPRPTVRFHPVWRDYPISTVHHVAIAVNNLKGFHPVWRDYPISTLRQNVGDPAQRILVSIPSGGIILFPRTRQSQG